MFLRPRSCLATAIALFGAGCAESRPSPPIPVHPVDGRVTFKGSPLSDALVIFHRRSVSSEPGIAEGISLPSPTGRTNAEGQFRMHTYVGDDGAPVGAYKVTVVPAGSAENRNLMARNVSLGLKVAIPRKYADPARSDLAATVNPGDNPALSFDLK